MKRIALFIIIILTTIACSKVINDIEEDNKREGIIIDPTLLQQKWDITFFREFGQVQTNRFDQASLSLLPGGSLQLRIAQDLYEGNWALSANNRLLVIRINQSGKPQEDLNNDWVVTELSQNSLRIIEEDLEDDAEFHFEKSIPKQYDWSLLNQDWQIMSFTKDSEEISPLYNDFIISFTGPNEYLITQLNEIIIPLTFDLDQTTAMIRLNNGDDAEFIPDPIFRNWLIDELSEQEMIWSSGSEKVLLRKFTGEINRDPKVFDQQRLKGVWQIFYYLKDNEDYSDLIGQPLLRLADQAELNLKLDNGLVFPGNWEFDLNQDRININLELEDNYLDDLDDDWEIYYLSDDTLKMIELGDPDTEVQLVKKQVSFLPYPDQLIDSWKLTGINNNSDDDSEDDDSDDSDDEEGDDDDQDHDTSSYDDLTLKFMDDLSLEVIQPDFNLSGTWNVNADQLEVSLPQNEQLVFLSGTWFISQISNKKIILQKNDDDDDEIELILEK
ncbi:MAG: hypothetical protein ACNS62_23585 [Candidatus Cyclobacteriaceae bacterium M3_2C_046]